MQSAPKQHRAGSEPLVLDGRIVDGCVQLVGIQCGRQLGPMVTASLAVLVAQLTELLATVQRCLFRLILLLRPAWG